MTKSSLDIVVSRAYEPTAESEDRYRVLVDRLWPRGIRKEDLPVDEWLKDVAPSRELRQWFGHDPQRWEEFQQRYFAELEKHPESWSALLDTARRRPVCLVYGARDEEHNNAVALKTFLEQR